jgi:Cys-rich protein (TIGR01571 family)
MVDKKEEWGGGLCGCLGNDEDCGIFIAALFCPAVVYGINYSIVMKTDDSHSCIMPCIAHALLDSFLSTLACCGGPCVDGRGTPLPLACCLRYNHRRVALWMHNDKSESKAMSMVYETLCWSCSLAQVHRQFKKNGDALLPSGKIVKGNNLTGWLTKNTMNATDAI